MLEIKAINQWVPGGRNLLHAAWITISLHLLALAPAAWGSAGVWTELFGGADADLGYAVALAEDGGAAAVGFRSEGNLIDAYLVRTDRHGQLLWQSTLSLSPLSEIFYDVWQTANGDWIAVGSVDLPDAVGWRPWVVRLDDHGSIVWHSSLTLTQQAEVDSGIVRGAPLPGGRFVIAGGTNTFTNVQEPWVAVLDEHGAVESFEVYPTLGASGNGFTEQTYVLDVAATADGGFVLAGTLAVTTGRGYLWKFDSHAQPSWSATYGSSFLERVEAVQQNAALGFDLVGCSQVGCRDTLVLRTDVQGLELWSATFDDPSGGVTTGRDIGATTDNGLLVLQTFTEAAGSHEFESSLLDLDSTGALRSTTPLVAGTASTRLVGLDTTSTHGIASTAVGSARDSSDPGAIDLTIVRFAAAEPVLIFRDGFEDPQLPSWR